MNRMMIAAVMLVLVSTAAPSTLSAQDPAAVAAAYYRVRFENDRVRVLETTGNPGDTIPMHAHPAGFGYTLTPCKLTMLFPDGRSKTVDLPAGELLWHEAVIHALVIREAPVRILHTELKSPPSDAAGKGRK